MENKNFYISVDFDNKKTEFITYCSDSFLLTEEELLIILKILLAEKRNAKIGKKILSIYKDSTNDRIGLTEERLKQYCIKDERPKQIKTKSKIK